jgi:hypothetical protein
MPCAPALGARVTGSNGVTVVEVAVLVVTEVVEDVVVVWEVEEVLVVEVVVVSRAGVGTPW